MAKMYYNLEEVLTKLACNEDQLKALVRSGKLREFRDAGKLNYRVDEVDRLASPGTVLGDDSGEMAVDDIAEIALTPVDPGVPASLSGSGSSGEIPIDLGGSGTGLAMGRTGSGEIRLDDSRGGTGTGAPAGKSGSGSGLGTGSGEIKLEDSSIAPAGPSRDAMSLDEVDKDVVQGMKKDDTVITNIGISVFDDDDLEIAADPMAKTLLAGGEEHLGLDGSGGGSGLLDLTRESDDTSLGAELLEGIDMGDTAETMAQSATEQSTGTASEPEAALPTEAPADMGVAIPQPVVMGMIEPVSPAFTGLLAGGALVMFVAGATAIAMATSEAALPKYLTMLAESFWMSLGGTIVIGGLFALVGWLIGRTPAPRAPKPPKEKKVKEKQAGKPKKGDAGAAPA